MLLSVSIINGAGSGYLGNGGGNPPDVTGAAGPNSYLEVTNSTVTLFSPKGPNRTILAQHNIGDFFYNPSIGNQTVIDAPFSVTVPIAAGPTGATEAGNTVTITTTASHGFNTGDTVQVSGVGVPGYNGTFTITAVTATTFQYTDPLSGLTASGGGTASNDPGSCGVCDSTGFFDNLMGTNGRFVIADIDVDQTTNVSQYLLAVSTTSNPTTFTTADWNFYHVTTTEGTPGNSAWTDYPGNPGFNKDAVVDTFNMFGSAPYGGNSQIVSIDAADLANGVPQASLHVYKNDRPGFSYRATQMQDSAPGDPMWLVRNPEDGTHVDVIKMDNVLSNSASFTTTSLALPAGKTFVPAGVNNPLEEVDDGNVPDVAYNPGNSPASDIDNRILNASEFNNTIVAAQKIAVGTASVVTAAVKINKGSPVAGSGYTVGDVLTLNGGTGTAAQLTVATVGGSGNILTVTVSNPGNYSSLGGIDGTATGGSGSGVKFTLTFRGETDVQWYAIDVSGGAPAFQQVGGVDNVGRIGFGPDTYCVDPAVAINAAGEIGLGFMESDTLGGAINGATAGFLSTYVTARKSTDAAGAMQPVVLVSAGTGSGTITGRIGDFSGTNVDPVNGTFWHVNEFGGAGGPTVIANFTPEDPPIVTAPSDQTGVEGTTKLFNLGSFSDGDGSPWTVSVDWGDGTNTTFSVAADGSLGTKTHTYVEESAADHFGSNPYVVTVKVTDFTNLSDSATFNVTVSDPAVIATGGYVVNAVEGAASGLQTVATFTDPGGPEALADYSATIDWGDGTSTSAGAITFSAGVFTVQGNHTYAEESAADHPGSDPYVITVTVSHESTTPQVVVSSAAVSDPAVAGTGGFTFTAVEGTPSTVQTVATFTDPGGAEVLGDYSALINWGDGTPATVGTISGPDGFGVFTVTGSHTYATGTGQPDEFGNTFCGADPPYYHRTITVTLLHEAAPPTVVNDTATISLPPASAHLAGGSLIVVGTTSDDHVLINPVGNTGQVDVNLNSVDLGSFALGAGGRIIVAAIAGNDNIQVAAGVQANTVLYGGPGNDRIKGGGGQNILVGCEGDDQLIAGNQGDLLIGGEGADTLNGGAGNDILVAGTVINQITLLEDDKYSDLVAILNGGPVTAVDDGAVDVLQGASGIDTLYYHFLGPGAHDAAKGKTEIVVNI